MRRWRHTFSTTVRGRDSRIWILINQRYTWEIVRFGDIATRDFYQHNEAEIKFSPLCMKIVVFSFKSLWNIKGPINNNPALVKIMAWYREGHKPLSEQMIMYFTDAWTRPQQVKRFNIHLFNCFNCLSQVQTTSGKRWYNSGASGRRWTLISL